ncbi:MAG: response regulator [Sandaracinaceae bacterium]|nr:response regulator [Sandaracinaceae bacterium]
MSEELRDDSDPSARVEPATRPRTVPPEEQRKLARARRAVATIPPVRVRGVLVVEDDPDLQWRLARMLTVRGNRVVGTSSAEGAIELLRQWPVDLVLVDDSLPGMSGVELAKVVAAEHPETAVVLMSSEDDEGGRSALAARLAGAVATIAKPFRPEALLELLSSFPKGEPELA